MSPTSFEECRAYPFFYTILVDQNSLFRISFIEELFFQEEVFSNGFSNIEWKPARQQNHS